MNLKKIRKVLTSKSVGTGPTSYEKRTYRAAVSQRLRNTVLEGLFLQFSIILLLCYGTVQCFHRKCCCHHGICLEGVGSMFLQNFVPSYKTTFCQPRTPHYEYLLLWKLQIFSLIIVLEHIKCTQSWNMSVLCLAIYLNL